MTFYGRKLFTVSAPYSLKSLGQQNVICRRSLPTDFVVVELYSYQCFRTIFGMNTINAR